MSVLADTSKKSTQRNKMNSNDTSTDLVMFPFEIKELSREIQDKMLEDFTGERSGFVQIGPEKYLLPYKFMECSDQIYNFQSTKDDIWICTYPRSGTTWAQEMIWLIANNLDYEAAKKTSLLQRFPFFEFHLFFHNDLKQEILKEMENEPLKKEVIETMSIPGFQFFSEMKSPRFIKTHLPPSLLPYSVMQNMAKLVYIIRNPKDVIVSFYHLNKLYRTQGYINSFEKFYDYFVKDLMVWAPYWSHVKEGWNLRNYPNVFFIFYEDFLANLEESLKKLSKFLGKPLTENDLPRLIDHLHIKNFKNNPAVNYEELRDLGILSDYEHGCVRSGGKGKHSDYYTPELLKRVDSWIDENLRGCDIKFPN